MKKSFLLCFATAVSMATHAIAIDEHYIFKATALFPVQIEKPDPKDPAGGSIITKVSLGSKELVNLALGRSVFTPINPKTEVLAVDVNVTNPNAAKLIVYRPGTGARHPICMLTPGEAPNTKLAENEDSAKGKGTGLAPGTIVATDAAFPGRTQNRLDSTDIFASANGGFTEASGSIGFGATPKSPHSSFKPPVFTLSATGVIGPIKGQIADKAGVSAPLDGVIVKGMFTSSGKPIDRYFQ